MRKPERTGPRIEAYRLKAEGKKRCADCREIKPLEAFGVRRVKDKDYKKHWCRVCLSRYNKAHYRANRDDILQRSKKHYKTHYMKLRGLVFAALGDHCACCGEDEPQFLTVDHVNNDGYLDKRNKSGFRVGGWSNWHKMRREGFPKGRYQILCFNCNCGRHRAPDRVCPHQKQEPRLMAAC